MNEYISVSYNKIQIHNRVGFLSFEEEIFLREILSKQQLRHLMLIETLYYMDDWVKLSELSRKLHCSDRILKDDIAFFRDKHTSFNIETSSYGIRIAFHENVSIDLIHQNLLKEMVEFKILEYIFFHENQTIDSISNIFFVSKSTLYRMIKRINRSLKKHYHIELESGPLCIAGAERDIRYFYSQYFTECYANFEWPFETIDEPSFVEFLLAFTKILQIPMDYGTLCHIKIVTAVNFIRLTNHHWVSNRQSNNLNILKFLSKSSDFKKIAVNFQELYGFDLDLPVLEQLFVAFVQKDFHFDYSSLINQSKLDEHTKKSTNFLDCFLDQLASSYGITLTNKESLILDLHNTSHLEKQTIQSNYILFDKKKHFVQQLQNEYPEFFKNVYNGIKMYRKHINQESNEIVLNHLVYTLFTHWERLFFELEKRQQPIYILVISDYDRHHAEMIVEMIDLYTSNQVIVERHTDLHLSCDSLAHSKYNIIVSSSYIGKIENKHIIYIESLMTTKVISEIQRVVKLLKEKNLQVRNTRIGSLENKRQITETPAASPF